MELKTIISIIFILAYLFIIGFSMYLPIFYLFRNKKLALKFSIPLSISCEIIFGYIFYNTGTIKIFPTIYLILITLINVILLIKLNLNLTIKFNSWKNILPATLIIISLVYTRFYDSILNISPGNIDTFNHALFLKDLASIGYIGNTYYAPGFHIFLFPFYSFFGITSLYRFAGPAIGLLIILSILFLFIDIFKKRESVFLMLLLFSIPLFNDLSMQTISFFSSSLSFIFFATILYLLIHHNEFSDNIYFIFFLLLIFALSITVPYMLIGIISTIGVFFLYLFANKQKKYSLFVFKLLIIASFGLLVAFGHVFLQTKILHPKENGFPKIPIINTEKETVSVTNNYTNSYLSNKNIFINKYIYPLYTSGIDILKIKKIRRIDSIISAGAYVWIIISFFAFIYSTKKKNETLLIISFFSIIYGIITQSGILEMSYYKGRNGWYLMLLSILGASFIFDIIYKNKYKNIFMILFIILFFYSFTSPPIFYREYFIEPFNIANKIKQNFPNQKIQFITNYKEISLLSNNFSIKPLNPSSLELNTSINNQFLILNKKYFYPDPTKYHLLLTGDKNFQVFRSIQNRKEQEQKKTNDLINNSDKFNSYKIYYENKNIIIYEYKK